MGMFSHTGYKFAPVGNILVHDSRCDVEHDDVTLALNLITVSKATKLFLTGRIPGVEADGAKVGGEGQRVHFDTKSRWWSIKDKSGAD
jgi:hypothetical protein